MSEDYVQRTNNAPPSRHTEVATHIVWGHDPAQASGQALPDANHADQGRAARHHLDPGWSALHSTKNTSEASSDEV